MNVKVVDLCCGIGWFSYPYSLLEYEVVGGFDKSPKYEIAYNILQPKSVYYQLDASILEGNCFNHLFKHADIRILLISLPLNFNNLLSSLINYIKFLKPEFVIIENERYKNDSKQFLTVKHFKDLKSQVENLGYFSEYAFYKTQLHCNYKIVHSSCNTICCLSKLGYVNLPKPNTNQDALYQQIDIKVLETEPTAQINKLIRLNPLQIYSNYVKYFLSKEVSTYVDRLITDKFINNF